MEKERRSPWLFVLLSLIVVVGIYYGYLRATGVDIINEMKENSMGLLFSAMMMLLAELVKAARSYVIFKKTGYRVSFKNLVISRFVGNFMGIVTPASFASEPGRVMSLAMLEGTPLQAVMAIGVLETFYDSIMMATIALIFSLSKLPASIFVFISSFFILGLWGFILVAFVYKDSLFRKIIYKFEEKMGKRIKNFSYRVLKRYTEFTDLTKTGLGRKLSLVSFLFTIASILIYSVSFLTIDTHSGGMPWQLLRGTIAYSSSYIMQVFPTPGGSGFFEYALSLTLNPEESALWRMVYLFVNVIPTSIILIFFVRIRFVIIENIKKSIFDQ
ncbi:MAG: flippase-like domain-containing protein [Fervidicoccaceae archaeon]